MNAVQDIKDDRSYTKDHEWAKDDNGELVVGITAFAVDQLGDITLVNIDVAPGDTIEHGKAFGTIESVKTLSDLFAPVSGKVTRVNEALEDSPELVNEDCWTKGWMIAIEPSKLDAERGGLLDHAGYAKHVEESDH